MLVLVDVPSLSRDRLRSAACRTGVKSSRLVDRCVLHAVLPEDEIERWAKHVGLGVKRLRTRVRFPPPPPSNGALDRKRKPREMRGFRSGLRRLQSWLVFNSEAGQSLLRDSSSGSCVQASCRHAWQALNIRSPGAACCVRRRNRRRALRRGWWRHSGAVARRVRSVTARAARRRASPRSWPGRESVRR